jgi:nicotinate-nucleotide adenylyltransferase
MWNWNGGRKMPSKIAILGGTFDPIHIGHLILADQACDQLGLSLVYIVPVGNPPHKQGRQLASEEDRLRMIELAIAGNPVFKVSRVDIDRPGPQYTLDTVRIFRQQMPPDGELYFLMGYDSLAELPTWYRPQEFVAACHLVALTRYNVPIDWLDLETALPGIRERVTLLDMPEVEISSHQIQERVQAGSSIRYLVPDAVRTYIMEHALYKAHQPDRDSLSDCKGFQSGSVHPIFRAAGSEDYR